MLGQEVTCGTGFFDVLLDENKLIENISKMKTNSTKVEEEIIEDLDNEDDDYCMDDDDNFGFNLEDTNLTGNKIKSFLPNVSVQ